MSIRRTGRGLGLAAAAALIAAALALSGAASGSPGAKAPPIKNCPNTLDGFLAADGVVGAYSDGTTARNYFFDSFTDRDPVGGVPGLVGYCVYTNQTPTDVTPEYESWKADQNAGSFSFVRPKGEKTNIPLDGKTGTLVGTASFSDEPTTETILLHISDAATCQALYGGDVTTCYVLPGKAPGPVCDAASSSDSNAAYNSIPKDAVDCGPPSHAFEATQTKEFGNEVVLSKSGTLGTLKVLFNSYACEDSPQWNNQYCATTVPGHTFTHPITANIYAVGANHTVGSLLASVTVTQTIPYRPSADTTNCGTTGAWFNTVSGNCEFSAKTVLTFTFPSGQQPTLNAGDHVIWTVGFATSTNGETPTDSSQCTVNAGCPYDSLNVGTKTFVGSPYAGTEADTHAAFINSTWNGIYCDDGVGGTGSLRVSTNPPDPCTNTEAVNNYEPDAWLGLTPLATIILN